MISPSPHTDRSPGQQPEIRTLAGLENEGHALPPGVVNPEGSRSVCRADGVVRHGVVIEITGLSICRHILAEERVAALNGRNRTEHLDLQRGKDKHIPPRLGDKCAREITLPNDLKRMLKVAKKYKADFHHTIKLSNSLT